MGIFGLFCQKSHSKFHYCLPRTKNFSLDFILKLQNHPCLFKPASVMHTYDSTFTILPIFEEHRCFERGIQSGCTRVRMRKLHTKQTKTEAYYRDSLEFHSPTPTLHREKNEFGFDCTKLLL